MALNNKEKSRMTVVLNEHPSVCGGGSLRIKEVK